ncbi:MAG: hypothetical protein JST21_03015 [Bacteroidetes bacterium]|nr:hypothetical protein [Bacteroidota bacterium]
MQAKKLCPHIINMLPNTCWNFDLEDCDKILWIESEKDIIVPVKALLHHHHFICEELE